MAVRIDNLAELEDVSGTPDAGDAPIYDGTNFAMTQTYSKAQVDTLLTSYATTASVSGKLNANGGNAYGTLLFLDGSDNTTASINANTGLFTGDGTGLNGVALLAARNVFAAPSSSSSANIAQTFTATYTNSSGSSTPYVFTVTDSTTGTAGFSALVVNRAGSGTGSASKFLLDLRDGGSTKLSVDRFGSGIFSGNLQGGNLYTQGFLRAAGSGANIAFTQSFTNVSATRMTFSANGSATGTSGTEVCVDIAPTYNQTSGTTANTALRINATQTAVGSGTQLLQDWQVGGSSLARMTNTGAFTAVSLNLGGATVTDILSATATLDFAATDPSDLTITVTGAATGDTVCIGPQHASVGANNVFYGWVSAADTVTIRKTGSADPASGTFRATVIKI